MENEKLNRTDLLAIERTKLANERTFLAYFRTFIVFLSSGFAILKLDVFKEISELAYFLLIVAPVLLLIGFLRFYFTRKRLKKVHSKDY